MGCMKTPVRHIVLCALVATGLAAKQDPMDSDRPSHIVGGESVAGGEFPFVAKIVYYDRSVGCTGSLIASDKVLTAKHCVDSYSLRALSVSFGNTRSEGSSHPAIHVSAHPFFSTVEHDLAIIQFAPPVSIQPVPLLTREEELKFVSGGERGMAVGWGRTDAGGSESLPEMLQKGAVPIYRETECKRVLGNLRDQGKHPSPPGIYASMLCAGQENKAPAAGDSGGPLLVQTPDGWAQVGVLSQSTRNGKEVAGNPAWSIAYMGHYSRTAVALDWIYSSDAGEAEDPPGTIDPYRLHFSHFASGDGLETDLLLLNPQLEVAGEASVEVFSPDGTLRFPLRRVTAPAAGMVEWTLPVGEELETGSIVVTSRTRLSGILRFRYSDGGATAVSATPLGGGFVVPLSSRSDRTGVAIRNAGTEPVTVALSLGSLPKANRTIPSQGQIAAFVDEYFPNQADQEVEGTLLVQAEPPGGVITVLALEFVGDSLVTLPATILNDGDLGEKTP